MIFRQASTEDIPELVECRIWLEASKWGKPVYKRYGFSVNDDVMTIEVDLRDEKI